MVAVVSHVVLIAMPPAIALLVYGEINVLGAMLGNALGAEAQRAYAAIDHGALWMLRAEFVARIRGEEGSALVCRCTLKLGDLRLPCAVRVVRARICAHADTLASRARTASTRA